MKIDPLLKTRPWSKHSLLRSHVPQVLLHDQVPGPPAGDECSGNLRYLLRRFLFNWIRVLMFIMIFNFLNHRV